MSACAAQEGEHVALLDANREQPLGATALFGAFTYGGVWGGMEPVFELETDIGRRLDIVHWFSGWDAPFYPELVTRVTEGGRLAMISWQPDHESMSDIANGALDGYVRAWARGAAEVPGPVYVRPFAEMNGDWVPWFGDNATFRRAWRRVVDIFEEEGASNVLWVFSPNVTDWPVRPENSMEAYYPGHDYVDVLALDGYNWGETKPNLGWQSFATIFREGYDRIAAIGDQPIWIAELASSDEGGDKAAWVSEMFSTTGFERIEALVWFNEDKEADWRMNSDASVLHAFQAALTNGPVLASTGAADGAASAN